MNQNTAKPKETPMDIALRKMMESRANTIETCDQARSDEISNAVQQRMSGKPGTKTEAKTGEAYFAPELFAKEVARRMEERRSQLSVERLSRAQVEEIVRDVFKTGLPRPAIKEDGK